MQEYEGYSREELMSKIASLDRLNKKMLQTFQKSERLEFGWTGNLGQWFWDLTTNEVTFNPLKAEAIGYMKEDLPEKVPFQFFTDKLHPDDKENVMQLMRDHLAGEIPVWEVKYRIQAKDGSWKVYQDRGKITERNEKGEPLFLTGIVFDVTEEEQGREELESKNKHLTNRLKTDPLTSLYTRSAITVELVKCASRAKQQSLSIVFLKVDNYTKLEEDFGIVLSEEVLKTTGKIIQTVLQDKYSAGRFRESVFLILMENTNREQAYELAEIIRQTIFETLFEIPRNVSLSASITTYNPSGTISELVQNGSKKLVAASKNGGNQIVG